MTTLDCALDVITQLSFDQRQMLIDILHRRQAEERREEIAANAREAIRTFHAGELKTETAEELISRLHASVISAWKGQRIIWI